MRRLLLLLLSFALCAGGGTAAAAEAFAHPWNPRTGDDWTDRQLADVNRYGDRQREAFVDELVRYFDLPRPLATELLARRRWAPGDVYYACALARVAGRPCRTALDAWAQGYADGWAPVATGIGIAPGSEQAARVRLSFVDSYRRWARPLTLDAALAREVRARERAARRAAAEQAAAEKAAMRKHPKD